jgi:hypothetical protein
MCFGVDVWLFAIGYLGGVSYGKKLEGPVMLVTLTEVG